MYSKIEKIGENLRKHRLKTFQTPVDIKKLSKIGIAIFESIFDASKMVKNCLHWLFKIDFKPFLKCNGYIGIGLMELCVFGRFWKASRTDFFSGSAQNLPFLGVIRVKIAEKGG